MYQKTPNTFKQLRKFLLENGGYDCFCKWGGEVYKITRGNSWVKVCRNITDFTYEEYLKESLK